jgi:hypothetical protein
MQKNPFTSKIFETAWLRHFNDSKPSHRFNFIKNISFIKKSFIPLYINTGKNLTKGISYNLVEGQSDYKGKVFLLYDIPDYFEVSENTNVVSEDLVLDKIFQYNGYMMDLSNFDSPESYIKEQFKKNNKRYIRWSHIKRLEECFDISYEFIYGEVSDDQYEFIFEHFYKLLHARFKGKHTDYHHLKNKKRQFYKDVILPLIKTNQASFLVIYNDGIPIGINLNYHSENTLFKAITVFDANYYKFSIGKLSVLKLIDWCFEHNYRFSDFSKGYFDYKEIWGNTKYDFNYHLLYDKKSVKAVLTAKTIKYFFNLKSFLRKKNVNHSYRKLLYKIKGQKLKKENHFNFETIQLSEIIIPEGFKLVDLKNDNYVYILNHVYSFLFTNPESFNNIKVYKELNTQKFIIRGTNNATEIDFK